MEQTIAEQTASQREDVYKRQGYECGIGLEKFNDIRESDILEAFIMEEYRD